jgi:hypothetical protein
VPAQFLAWDTFARQRVDMIGRKDHGDRVIAHEFDYSIKQQVRCVLRPCQPLEFPARLLVARGCGSYACVHP